MTSFITHNDLLINEDFYEFLKSNGLADFRSLVSFEGGSILKKKDSRSIVKIEKGDKTFFLKRHSLSWGEKIRSIFPWDRDEDAKNEWHNILLLQDLGFNTITPVAFGEKGKYGLPHSSLTLRSRCHCWSLSLPCRCTANRST